MFNEVPGLGEDEIVAEQAEQRQQQQGGAEGMEVSS
jgi:hypothetical protein